MCEVDELPCLRRRREIVTQIANAKRELREALKRLLQPTGPCVVLTFSRAEMHVMRPCLSETEDEPQTRFNSGHCFRPNATDAFSEEAAIGCDDLRDVGNGRLFESRAAWRKENVAGKAG